MQHNRPINISSYSWQRVTLVVIKFQSRHFWGLLIKVQYWKNKYTLDLEKLQLIKSQRTQDICLVMCTLRLLDIRRIAGCSGVRYDFSFCRLGWESWIYCPWCVSWSNINTLEGWPIYKHAFGGRCCYWCGSKTVVRFWSWAVQIFKNKITLKK